MKERTITQVQMLNSQIDKWYKQNKTKQTMTKFVCSEIWKKNVPMDTEYFSNDNLIYDMY